MTFGSFPLTDLPLTPPQLAACERAGYSTASDILLAAPPELNRKLKNLTVQNIQNIVRIVAKSIAPSTGRVITIPEADPDKQGESSGSSQCDDGLLGLGPESRVGTGDEGLDEVLGGGLRTGTLTEISGESAAGKSHLCMALALSAQLSSCTTHPGGSIILTSERELPTDRLIQLAKSMLASHGLQRTRTVKGLLDNIHTNKCIDVDALDHALSYSLPWELEKNRKAGNPIRLIVLDSITALFRGADTSFSSTSSGLAQRSKLLCSIADKLKALASKYEIAVVVINQVSDVFNRLPQPQYQPTTQSSISASGPFSSQAQASQVPSAYEYATQFFTDPSPQPPMLYATQARWFSGQSQGYMKEASLGIVWANAVNTRIMMSRTLRRKRVPVENLSISTRKRRRVGGGEDDQGPGSRADEGDAYIGIELDSDAPTLVRRFHVVFSPFAPPSTIDYIIAPSGIHSLSASRRVLDLASIIRKKKVIEAMRAEAEEQGNDSGIAGLGGNGNGNGDGNGEDEYGINDDDLDNIPAEFWEGKFADQVAEPQALGVIGEGGADV